MGLGKESLFAYVLSEFERDVDSLDSSAHCWMPNQVVVDGDGGRRMKDEDPYRRDIAIYMSVITACLHCSYPLDSHG